jgi:hypothetical protein
LPQIFDGLHQLCLFKHDYVPIHLLSDQTAEGAIHLLTDLAEETVALGICLVLDEAKDGLHHLFIIVNDAIHCLSDCGYWTALLLQLD